MVVYNMFGLVPGEERLFANTIFLRLAEAFQLGNKHIRVSIVRVFLSLRRHCRDKKRSKRIKGILSKSRVHNHLELLKRVKIVFDTGDRSLFLFRQLNITLHGSSSTKHVHIMDGHVVDSNLLFSN